VEGVCAVEEAGNDDDVEGALPLVALRFDGASQRSARLEAPRVSVDEIVDLGEHHAAGAFGLDADEIPGGKAGAAERCGGDRDLVLGRDPTPVPLYLFGHR
jgi:hypothetical protein